MGYVKLEPAGSDSATLFASTKSLDYISALKPQFAPITQEVFQSQNAQVWVSLLYIFLFLLD